MSAFRVTTLRGTHTLLGIFALAGIAAAASADEASASSLTWIRKPGAESCIGQAELRKRVEARLSRKLVREKDARLQIRGEIAAKERGWVARIEARDVDSGGGTRTLTEEGTDCRKIDAALVLAVTLMIDPDAPLAPEPPPTPSPEPETGPEQEAALTPGPPPERKATTPPAQPPPARAPTRQPRPGQPTTTPWRFGPSVSGVGAVGVLPGVALGGAAGATVIAPSWWSIQARGALWAKTDSEPTRARLGLSQFSLRLCVLPASDEHWMLSACGGAGLGLITAQGRALDNPQSDSGSFPFALASLGVSRHLFDGLWLSGATTLAAPIARTRVSFRRESGASETIYRAPAANLTAALGLTFYFSS